MRTNGISGNIYAPCSGPKAGNLRIEHETPQEDLQSDSVLPASFAMHGQEVAHFQASTEGYS